jgi:hypothetical protein
MRNKIPPQLKAVELIEIYGKVLVNRVINEIINALKEYDERTETYLRQEHNIPYMSSELQNMESDFIYWSKVKQEVNNNLL